MGKNRKFKNSYLVTIQGTTSNGFQAELFDEIVHAVAQAFGVNSQQCTVTVKSVDTEGDYNTESRINTATTLNKETK